MIPVLCLVPALLQTSAAPPAAAPLSLSVLDWMQGAWRAEAGPERLDEHWCLEGGSLMGFTRTLAGDRSTAFELMLLEPAAEGWVMRVRMFGPSLDTATRGKETPLRLKLVEADQSHLLLEGLGPETGTRLSYRLEDPDRMVAELSKTRNGKPWKQVFRFTRTGP